MKRGESKCPSNRDDAKPGSSNCFGFGSSRRIRFRISSIDFDWVSTGWFNPSIDGPLIGGTDFSDGLKDFSSRAFAAALSEINWRRGSGALVVFRSIGFRSAGRNGGRRIGSIADTGVEADVGREIVGDGVGAEDGKADSGSSGFPGRLGSSRVPHIPQKRYSGLLSYPQWVHLTYIVVSSIWYLIRWQNCCCCWKVLGAGEGATAIANLVSSSEGVELSIASGADVSAAELTVNARVAIDPARLSELVESEAIGLVEAKGLSCAVTDLQSFRPGRPMPTHRMPLGQT